VKFLSEYTRTVLSLVAVAIKGMESGFGIEAQARELAGGLKSERGTRRMVCGEGDVSMDIFKEVIVCEGVEEEIEKLIVDCDAGQFA